MRSIREFWGLIFKRHVNKAQKSDQCRPSQIKTCPCDAFAHKPEQRFPEKGWRLLNHISYTIPTAIIDDTHDIELDEDILERIDFWACLFGNRKSE